MGWRDVRLNKVAQHVFMRQEMEFQERLDGGRARYQHLVDEAGRWGSSSRIQQKQLFCFPTEGVIYIRERSAACIPRDDEKLGQCVLQLLTIDRCCSRLLVQLLPNGRFPVQRIWYFELRITRVSCFGEDFHST